MNVLLIGYGSIGKRHYEVLSSLKDIKKIDIVTKQVLLQQTTFKTLQEMSDLDAYDYFVIASRTSEHYKQLHYLEEQVTGKIILCEKPLFENQKTLLIHSNQVYVGYVLRFYPLMQKLKKILLNEKILNIQVNCGQYLPTWRPECDYRASYSAKKAQGGGVLLDLSHEIDYTQWLCGKMQEIKSYQVKISDLEIDSDDLTTFVGQTDQGIIVNLSIDYISKKTYRKIMLNTLEHTYQLDFLNNTLTQTDKFGKDTIYRDEKAKRNNMFMLMHQAIIDNQGEMCSYTEALAVMDTITKIQEQNR